MALFLALLNVFAAYLVGALVIAWVYGRVAKKRPGLRIDSASVAWFAVLWPFVGLCLIAVGPPMGFWELLRWIGRRAGALDG